MCGIIGIIGKSDAQPHLMEALKRLSPDKPAPWRDPRMEIRPR